MGPSGSVASGSKAADNRDRNHKSEGAGGAAAVGVGFIPLTTVFRRLCVYLHLVGVEISWIILGIFYIMNQHKWISHFCQLRRDGDNLLPRRAGMSRKALKAFLCIKK